MTMLVPEMIECALCGAENEVIVVTSTNTFGSPDLDLRPAPMMREILPYEVQRCESCGYCDNDITDLVAIAAQVIIRPDYLAQLGSDEFPELANSFLCASMIQEAAGDLSSSAWAVVRAAWTCDDDGLDAQARRCRQQACALIDRAHAVEQRLTGDDETESCLQVDVLRRAGMMDEAREKALLALYVKPEDQIATVLRYQISLVESGDTSIKKLSDALPSLDA